MSKEDFEAFKKEVTNKFKTFFIIITVFLTIITLFMGGSFIYNYSTSSRVGTLEADSKQMRLDINKHEQVIEALKGKALKKEQFVISMKIIYLKIDKVSAIVEGRNYDVVLIDKEIRQLEGQLLTLDTEDVTRGTNR